MYHSLLKSVSYRANMLHCLCLCVIVAVSLSAVQTTGKKVARNHRFPKCKVFAVYFCCESA